ncbi:unnamed protein product [Cuscuta campestris]|uniref:DUF7769 domain-containing protein n=1 Tax=Cuscuta campestris TaxID=132261 RepID=A0A484LAK5_9ASTE|nr:unnamed protein product [Cuscuta campestris]
MSSSTILLPSPPVIETQTQPEVEIENQSNAENQRVNNKCTHKLCDETRALIIQTLLQNLKKGKPGTDVMKQLAEQYQINPKTVQRLWAEAKQQMKDGISVRVIGRMKGKSCGKAGLSLPVDKVSAVSPNKRRTIRALAKAVSM